MYVLIFQADDKPPHVSVQYEGPRLQKGIQTDSTSNRCDWYILGVAQLSDFFQMDFFVKVEI